MWKELISISAATGIVLAGGKLAWDIATSSLITSDKPATATPNLCHDAFGEAYVVSPCRTPNMSITKTPEPHGHTASELAKNGNAVVIYEQVTQTIAMR